MNNQEKKQLKNLIENLENAQADVSIFIMQEQDRLDSIGGGISQLNRVIKLESNVDNLETAEEALGNAIIALEEILS